MFQREVRREVQPLILSLPWRIRGLSEHRSLGDFFVLTRAVPPYPCNHPPPSPDPAAGGRRGLFFSCLSCSGEHLHVHLLELVILIVVAAAVVLVLVVGNAP